MRRPWNIQQRRKKHDHAIRQYEKAIAEFDAFIEEQGLGEEFAAFLERTERDIEEKKTVLDEAEDTNGAHDKAETEDEEEKKKDRNKSRMCL